MGAGVAGAGAVEARLRREAEEVRRMWSWRELCQGRDFTLLLLKKLGWYLKDCNIFSQMLCVLTLALNVFEK